MTKTKERISDYNQTDYNEFWSGNVKKLLDNTERAFARRLLPDTGGWFLDVGCGYGRLVPEYYREDRQIVLVDYAMNLLQKAEKDYPDGNIHFIAADAYHMPFRDEVFLSGISYRLFHHMNVPGAFLKEISRVLGGGARFVLEYSNSRNLLRILRKGIKAFVEKQPEYGELLFGTHPRFFGELCGKAGLRIEKTFGTGFIDQFVKPGSLIDRCVGSTPVTMSAAAVKEIVLDATLGKASLAPLHYARLRKNGSAQKAAASGSLIDILACPWCGSGELKDKKTEILCTACGMRYAKAGRIVDFRPGKASL